MTLECNQKSSAAVQSLTVELTIGLMEAVEALFDRRGATSSIMGFSLPIDNVLPSYSEVRQSFLIFCEMFVCGGGGGGGGY